MHFANPGKYPQETLFLTLLNRDVNLQLLEDLKKIIWWMPMMFRIESPPNFINKLINAMAKVQIELRSMLGVGEVGWSKDSTIYRLEDFVNEFLDPTFLVDDDGKLSIYAEFGLILQTGTLVQGLRKYIATEIYLICNNTPPRPILIDLDKSSGQYNVVEQELVLRKPLKPCERLLK